MKKTFKVAGMDCVSCAKSIERAVKKVENVNDANVSFASEKMFVEYANDIDDKKIIEAVKNSGCSASPDGPNMETEHPEMDHSKMGHEGHDHAKMESDSQISLLKKKFIFGAFTSIIVMFLSFGGQAATFIPSQLSLILMLALAIPVEFWVGKQFWRGMYYELKNMSPGMDSLVALGTGAAFLFSVAITVMRLVPQFSGFLLAKFDPYFDAAVVVVTLIILGKYLEARAKGSASEAIKKLLKLQAKIAHHVDDRGNIHDMDIAMVKVGDVLLVKQGEKVPVDGVIVEGEASLDESMVTGESLPTDKKIGDKVIGATINKSGLFKMKAVKVGNETFLAQIVKVVEEAQASKAPIQRLADKITGVFVPIVIAIAVGTFVAWMLLGPSPRLSYSIVNMVAVLVVACPCALGLATPIAVITGTSNGAEKGIIIRNAQALEVAGKTNVVILDKTGTITSGQPSVTDIVPHLSSGPEFVLQVAASLGKNTNHPLDLAVVRKAESLGIKFLMVNEFQIIPGKGISGTVGGKKYYFGNRKLISDANIGLDDIEKIVVSLEEVGKTALILSDNKGPKGVVGIADTVKKGAQKTVSQLKNMGIAVWMITGDNERVARYIAKDVGIENILASILPEQKSLKIKELQKGGAVVAMVGDGINDAPALTQADVGIAIGTGTDIAIESAGITLVSGDPEGIYKAITLSRKTLSNIKQNLFWAYAYNIILIPVATGVLFPVFGILLNPILAGGAMAFSSLSVVLNSLRLKRVQL
jgi:Cu+-exporting ATPase